MGRFKNCAICNSEDVVCTITQKGVLPNGKRKQKSFGLCFTCAEAIASGNQWDKIEVTHK